MTTMQLPIDSFSAVATAAAPPTPGDRGHRHRSIGLPRSAVLYIEAERRISFHKLRLSPTIGSSRDAKKQHGMERPRPAHSGEDQEIQERSRWMENLQEIGKSFINSSSYNRPTMQYNKISVMRPNV